MTPDEKIVAEVNKHLLEIRKIFNEQSRISLVIDQPDTGKSAIIVSTGAMESLFSCVAEFKENYDKKLKRIDIITPKVVVN